MLYTNLINKNNTWSNFAGQRKDCFDIFFSFTKPLQQKNNIYPVTYEWKEIQSRAKLFKFATNTLDVMLDIEMLIKFAPASVATAFASIVFPVPGGPKSNIPLQGYTQSNYN